MKYGGTHAYTYVHKWWLQFTTRFILNDWEKPFVGKRGFRLHFLNHSFSQLHFFAHLIAVAATAIATH